MKKAWVSWLAAGAGLVVACSGAMAQSAPRQIYFNTFEGALGPGWSSNAMINRDATAAFTGFVGRYTQNNDVTLTLGLPPESISGPQPATGGGGGGGGGGTGGTGTGGTTSSGTQIQDPRPPLVYRLTFDLFCIDSWDGLDPVHGQDRFLVQTNGVTVFNHAIARSREVPSWTTYAVAPSVGPAMLGFNSIYEDMIFRNVTIDFTLPAGTSQLTIRWQSQGLLNMNDESWGIDNVRLTSTVVPAPGSAAVLVAGAALAWRRRRAR